MVIVHCLQALQDAKTFCDEVIAKYPQADEDNIYAICSSLLTGKEAAQQRELITRLKR
jgi:hypothetical protein